MKAVRLTFTVLVLAALAALMWSCGGGGSDEEPQPRPGVDCNAKPETCK